MAIIKCKMCGGDLNITEGMSVAECEYCGTKQTVPNVDNEKKVTLFSRANRLRLACEFDKAAGVYENIVSEFPEEAEAYWGLVLCRYGIEYVDDPAAGKKVPTCHRSSFESILEDSDFEQACENADPVARKIYRDESKAIEEIRKGILEVSGKEPPYDIFICYKETDETGERTVDSVLAQDVYDALVEKGYRVFFSRITLEDKLGTEYEPYIFAALNSAKIMLVFGTDYEYFNAVWVKNEWSRFLKLMAQDKSKHLIPCYKDVDAYDLPKEFQKLQAQDLGKVGAVQDLLRGIDKLLTKGAAQTEPEPRASSGPTEASLLKRAQLLLEDGSWQEANGYFDKVLDVNPECAAAYWGKTLAASRCATAEAYTAMQTALPEDFAEEREAFPADTARIQAAVERYQMPPLLTESEIREDLNSISNCYFNVGDFRREKLEEKERMLQQHKLLSRAMQYAKGNLARQLQAMEGTILDAYRTWVREGEEQDAENIRLQREAYEAEFARREQHWAKKSETDRQKLEEKYAAADAKRQAAQVDENAAPEALRQAAAACGEAAIAFGKLGDYADARTRSLALWDEIAVRETVYTGSNITVAVRNDGRVLATEYTGADEYYDDYSEGVSEWTDVVAIAVSEDEIFGLKADHAVVTNGWGLYQHEDDWTDVKLPQGAQ